MNVERYFRASGVLTPLYYWLGASRTSAQVPYGWTRDRSAMVQGPSTAPFAHWNWYQPVARTYANYDCVLAYSAYAYQQYNGGASEEDAKNVQLYEVGLAGPPAAVKDAASLLSAHGLGLVLFLSPAQRMLPWGLVASVPVSAVPRLGS